MENQILDVIEALNKCYIIADEFYGGWFSFGKTPEGYYAYFGNNEDSDTFLFEEPVDALSTVLNDFYGTIGLN